jgi:hypothetical protein
VDGARPIPRISGNVDWKRESIALPEGAHTVRWTYAKDDSVSNGQDAAWLDEVMVGPPAPPAPAMANGLADALDVGAAVTLLTAGDGAWSSQTAVTHDGMDAAQSGVITHSQSTRLDATVTGPATLKFWWKVDSETNFDFLKVEVDGIEPIPAISGNVDWQQQTIALPAGAHTVRWTYSKDISVSERLDAAWVDQLTLE